MIRPLLVLLGATIVVPTHALELSNEFAMQAQAFNHAGSTNSHATGIAFSLLPVINHQNEAGDTYYSFSPFFRWDQRDDERTHADIRELKVLKVLDQWELEAGLSKVFWGVAESSHLVDIINQSDYLEGIDGEDKLGQPMFRASRIFDQSTLSLFVLPAFRQRSFLGVNSRFALPFSVDSGQAQFESSDQEKHVDYALRYSGYAGQMDYGVSWFKGTARDAQLRPSSSAPSVFAPYYQQIQRVGLDVQYTKDAWLSKLEMIHQESNVDSHHALVTGVEYTLFGLNDGAYDLGLIAEYNYDSRADAQSVLLQDDLFMGARFAFNDAESSSMLAGAIVDLEDNSRSLRFEGSRRVMGDAKLDIEAQVFSNIDTQNLLFGYRDNGFIRLELTSYF